MPNRMESKDGVSRKDERRPAPDVEQHESGGQSTGHARGATDEQGSPGTDPGYRGDGPAKVGLTGSAQPDLVAPSGVNERDDGVADDQSVAGGGVNFDDDDAAHPRVRSTAAGGTWEAQGGDSGKLGAPGAGLSDRNGPSDPDRLREPPAG